MKSITQGISAFNRSNNGWSESFETKGKHFFLDQFSLLFSNFFIKKYNDSRRTRLYIYKIEKGPLSSVFRIFRRTPSIMVWTTFNSTFLNCVLILLIKCS